MSIRGKLLVWWCWRERSWHHKLCSECKLNLILQMWFVIVILNCKLHIIISHNSYREGLVDVRSLAREDDVCAGKRVCRRSVEWVYAGGMVDCCLLKNVIIEYPCDMVDHDYDSDDDDMDKIAKNIATSLLSRIIIVNGDEIKLIVIHCGTRRKEAENWKLKIS